MLRLSVLVLWLAALGATEALRPWSTWTLCDGPTTIGSSPQERAIVPARGQARDTTPPPAVTGASWQFPHPVHQAVVSVDYVVGQPSARPDDHRLPARAPPAR